MSTKTRRAKPRARPRRKPRAKPDASLTPTGPGDKLSAAQQTAVVQRLAMYDTPQTVADWVKEDFGIELTRQSIQHYDPTVGEKPAEKWCAIFAATREEFLKTTAEIPIANRSVRLRRLERMAIAAERRGNYMLAASLYEQAAKEVGLLYTNSRQLGLSGEVRGGVLAVPVSMGADEWGSIAVTQQAALTTKAKEAATRATMTVGRQPELRS